MGGSQDDFSARRDASTRRAWQQRVQLGGKLQACR